MPLRILLVHEDPAVHESLRGALGDALLCSVGDLVSAKHAVFRETFGVIVVAHGFMGLQASFLWSWLKLAGARAPFVILAPGMAPEARDQLQELVGATGTVLASREPATVAASVRAQLRIWASREPEGALPGAADAWLVAKLQGRLLALRVDEEAFEEWRQFDLPPRLIALLDGTRLTSQVIAESGYGFRPVLEYLRWLYMAQCLEVKSPEGTREALPPARVAVWAPPEPPEAPDEVSSFAEVAVPELLLSLRRRGETGVAILDTAAWSLRVDLAEGSLVRAGGGPPDTSLGNVLLKLGHLDQARHTSVLEAYRSRAGREPSITIGDVAMQMGAVTAGQIRSALAAQIDPKIRAVVPATAGSCRFWRDGGVAVWQGIDPRPLEALIHEGLLENEDRRRELVRRFVERQGGSVVHAGPETLERLPLFRFGTRVQRFLRCAEGKRVDDALAASPIEPREAEIALYLLWAAGAIRLGD